jgi:hypothetical protein
MRRPALLFILVAFSLISCKKNEPVSPGLFGKWELRRKYGGLAGMDSVYKVGNGDIVQFNSDSTYAHYEKRKLANTGVFHIKVLYIPDADGVMEIYFNSTDYGSRFTFNGTKMTIGEDFDDGIATDYEKIGN